MSENYRNWIRGMKDSELNQEMVRLARKVVNNQGRPEVQAAWQTLLDEAMQEQTRRDEDHAHLLRGTNA